VATEQANSALHLTVELAHARPPAGERTPLGRRMKRCWIAGGHTLPAAREFGIHLAINSRNLISFSAMWAANESTSSSVDQLGAS